MSAHARYGDVPALKSVHPIQDVIAFCFGVRVYTTTRTHELMAHCWRLGHQPDRSPSCRVDLQKQVFFCDVCGSGGDVIRVVQEYLGGTFRQATRWLSDRVGVIPPVRVRPPRHRATTRQRRQRQGARGTHATYVYRTLDGAVLFEKLRTPDKQFFYRHRAFSGRWRWGLGQRMPVLYRLPDLVGRHWVLVVEGEKDVDAAWRHDLPATTNPEGAGNGKWKARYTQQLRRAGVRRAYVVPDNDAVGRVHTDQVVANCRAKRLQAWRVTLPKTPPHGNLSDYLAAGHGRRDVLRLMRRSRHAEPIPSKRVVRS